MIEQNRIDHLEQVCLRLLKLCESSRISEHGGGGDLLDYQPGLRAAARRLTEGVDLSIEFEKPIEQVVSDRFMINRILKTVGAV
jgi:hypothetical protein